MSSFAILLGGDLVPTPRLTRQIAGARVIAADSGLRHAEVLGVDAEAWVGDFDSADAALQVRHAGVPRLPFPPEKDFMDGELAVETALERGATSLVLVGAFGGPRADHAFLHLAAGLRLAERGVPTLLTSGDQEAVAVLPGSHRFDYEAGTMFSIACFSDLDGLTIEGARWPLDRVHVPFGSSLTLSNRVTGTLAITLGSGRAMLIAHPQD